jgi:hypothetical protein
LPIEANRFPHATPKAKTDNPLLPVTLTHSRKGEQEVSLDS